MPDAAADVTAQGSDFYTNYTVDVLMLISKTGGIKDILPHFGKIEIYEDIHSQFLSGRIDIIDMDSNIELLPLVGDEFIFCSIRLHGPHKITSRYIFFYMDIYSVEDEKIYKHKGLSYSLKLISQSYKKNVTKRTRKFYKGTQSDISTKIVEEQLGTKIIRTDPCLLEEEYIFPNWHPVSCINKMTKNSISAKYYDPDYVFYEDLDGFHYLSMSYMMEKDEVIPSTSDTFKNRVVDKIQDKRDDYNITEYNRKQIFDRITNTHNGMYGVTLINHDVLNRKWEESGTNYNGAFGLFKHNAGVPLTLLSTPADEKNKIIYLPMNGIINPGVYRSLLYKEQKKNLVVRQLQTEQNYFTLTIQGEPNMKIGRPMKFDMVSFKNDEAESDDDKLNGFFLILKIKHVFTRKEYTQFVDISKDSYEA